MRLDSKLTGRPMRGTCIANAHPVLLCFPIKERNRAQIAILREREINTLACAWKAGKEKSEDTKTRGNSCSFREARLRLAILESELPALRPLGFLPLACCEDRGRVR